MEGIASWLTYFSFSQYKCKAYFSRDIKKIIYMQDLPRTFPGHPWLDNPEGHAALRRVLVGYSFRDSDVGYCQVSLRSIL
jgi:hypothetical protein